MSITVNGHVHRTLNQPIYLGDGRQVKEAWQDGRKVYPDDIPKGRYVLILSGSIITPFQYAVLSDSTDIYRVLTAQMTGAVTVTIVSNVPTTLYEYQAPLPVGETIRSFYNSGKAVKVDKHGNMALVPAFPEAMITSRYAFAPAYDTFVGVYCADSTSVSTCDSDYAHRKIVISGSNSAAPGDRVHHSGWTYYIDGFVGKAAYYQAQLGEFKEDYHERSFGQAEAGGLSFRACFVDEAECGYVLYAGVPYREGWAAQGYTEVVEYPVAFIPLTEVVYNNNPPLGSPDNGPTEEVPESIIELL